MVLKRLIFWKGGGWRRMGGKKWIDSQTINVVRAKAATEAINRWSNVHSLSSDEVTLGECAWKSSKPWWIAIKVSRCLGTILSSTPSSFCNVLASTCYVYNRVRAEYSYFGDSFPTLRWRFARLNLPMEEKNKNAKQWCFKNEKEKRNSLIKDFVGFFVSRLFRTFY